MIKIFLPIPTVSEANCSEHWIKKAKRHEAQQMWVMTWWKNNKPEIDLPCVVTLIRLSSRSLDSSDNLPCAFKWIKDEIATQIVDPNRKLQAGRADDDQRITWQYKQEKSKIKAIRIEITF